MSLNRDCTVYVNRDSNFAPACFYSQIIGSIEISSNKLKSKKKCGEYMVSTNPTKYYYKEGDPTKEEIMLAPKNMLEIMLPLIGKLNEHNIEFGPFLAKTVKRFSISTENVLLFIDGLTIFLKWNQDGAEPLTPYKKSLKPLLAYKNSLSINSHFMSRFCVEEE